MASKRDYITAVSQKSNTSPKILNTPINTYVPTCKMNRCKSMHIPPQKAYATSLYQNWYPGPALLAAGLLPAEKM
jgi:hypothetical protein